MMPTTGTLERAPCGPEPAAALDLDVFEGPEKKLEVFFGRGASADGFRSFDQAAWSELLADASCSILHRASNASFDAYLLSESSLFVYPHRVILKTCGTTTLLLALPKLLGLAKRLGAPVEHVHYGHLRYLFPEQQQHPHRSFDSEREAMATLLAGHIDQVHATVLGPPEGQRWYALCAEAPRAPPAPPAACASPTGPPRRAAAASPSSDDGDEAGEDLFEVAMEGLPPDVCRRFFGDAYAAGVTGRQLAVAMTRAAGIDSLLPGVDIDDWAFEPCGYSMNGLRGAHYYTVHVTPEQGFSYASFETNDPAFRHPSRVDAVLSRFRPAAATLTLTTRRVRPELPMYAPRGYARLGHEHSELAPGVAITAMNFSREEAAAEMATAGTAAEMATAGMAAGMASAEMVPAEMSTAEMGSDCATISAGECSSCSSDTDEPRAD